MTTAPKDAYDRWAAQYDTDANDTRELNADVLRKQTFIGKEDAVLELGCGTGLNTEWLAAQAGSIVATDVSEEMLARARESLDSDSVTLQALDVTEPWPFEANRFDAVVSTLVLEHMEVLGPVFREARRVLRDSGTFYFAELHPYRQFGGTQAHFEDEAGFAVREMGEWRAEGDEQPRLLKIRFEAGPEAAGS